MDGSPGEAADRRVDRIPRRKVESVQFVVFSMPRTGSTMLTQNLSSHAAVRALPAIFSEEGWPKKRPSGGTLGWIANTLDPRWDRLEDRVAKPVALLRDIVKASPDKFAVGFKHHLGAHVVAVTNKLLNLGSGLRKIILTRNNMLAAYSSNKVAALTGQGSAKKGATIIAARVEFDAAEFTKFVSRRRLLYDAAHKEAHYPCMEIDYTAVRTEAGMGTIAAFLSIDPAGFGQRTTAKRNSDDIVSRFSNPDGVRAYLRDNGLEGWSTEA